MASLLDSLSDLVTPDTTRQIASKLGESDTAVSRGIQTGLASVLAGVVSKTGDSGAMRQIYELITSRENNTNVAGDLSALVRGQGGGLPTVGLGSTLLSTIFGDRSNGVSNIIASAAGFAKPSSGSSILAFVTPLVLGFFGQKVRKDGLSLAGLTSMLEGQRDSIRAAVPAGLPNVLDAAPATFRAARAEVPPARVVEEPRRTTPWLWPTLGGLAALALVWGLMARNRSGQTVTQLADSAATATRVALDSTLAAGKRTVDTAAGAVSSALRDLGALAKRTLPSGVVLNIPERGIESKLVAFIEDKSRPVNDTTWFEFDRLTFATNSAQILPESQEQLDNIAAVLSAYPNVKVKVGGYTDSTGDPAANKRLSQERADAVTRALATKGIAAGRLRAEGYGAEHPVADNSTEQGRAQNRRIALRVTAK